jgi:hypothetical protein
LFCPAYGVISLRVGHKACAVVRCVLEFEQSLQADRELCAVGRGPL